MKWFPTVKQKDKKKTNYKDRPVFWFQNCQQLFDLDQSLNFTACMCVYMCACVCICVCVCSQRAISLQFHLLLSFFLTPSFIPFFPQSFPPGFFFLPLSFSIYAPNKYWEQMLCWPLSQLLGTQTQEGFNSAQGLDGLADSEFIRHFQWLNIKEKQLLTVPSSQIHLLKYKNKISLWN